jgi:uncharacterized protein YndB with AHSA1/START domain
MPQEKDFTLEMTRVLPASRPVVFAAFTDPNQLAKWWGPEGFTVPSLAFGPRAGAPYRIEMQPPDGEPFFLTGTFREVEPSARLAYTFVWDPPDVDDVETLVELTFRDVGNGTEVELAQGRFKTEARRALHREGWGESFAKLDRLLAAKSE